jgi:hypothetical protein
MKNFKLKNACDAFSMLFFDHLVDIDPVQVFDACVVGVVEGEDNKDLWVARMIAKGSLVLLSRSIVIQFIHDKSKAEVQAGEMLVCFSLLIISTQVLF